MNNYFDIDNKFFNKDINKQNIDLYDPYEGFIRGNMYKELYDPYKISSPYEIKPMNEQAEMLTYIDALCFACIDLGLYLDVFSNNKDIINLFNKYNRQKNSLMDKYQEKFGPLTLDSDALNAYPWAWNERPWPWDNN